MNFGRAVRMAIRYKFTFAASILSALMVAVLWGADAATVYPFVEVGLFGRSPQNGSRSRSRTAKRRLPISLPSATACRANWRPAPAEKQGELRVKLTYVEGELSARQLALQKCRYLQPYIERYLPRDAFLMITLVIVLLLAGTVVKNVFLVANNVLVARLAQQATFDLRKLFYRRTLRMDLATFSEDGTADLMSRFTNDMNQLALGLESLFGKLIREPLKMFACLILAGWVCWRLLLLTLVVAPLAGYLVRTGWRGR